MPKDHQIILIHKCVIEVLFIVQFQVGIIAFFAVKPQSFSAFAAQIQSVGSACVMLTSQLLKGKKDFAATA